MKERIESLRRMVYWGLTNEKKNMVVDIDVLAAILNVHPTDYCRHGVRFEEWCKDCQRAGARR